MKEFSEYFNLFVKNKRVLLFSVILFFGIFYLFLLFTTPAENWKTSPEKVFILLIILPLPAFIFFALMGTNKIESLSKKTFWYTLLSIFSGVMVFLVPTVLITLVIVDVSNAVSYILFGILCEIAPQIPVTIRFRKYFFKKVNYVPTPTTVTSLFSYLLSLLALVPITFVGFLKHIEFGFEIYIRWSYLQRNIICVIITLIVIFLSYLWTLRVIKNDGKERLWEKWFRNV